MKKLIALIALLPLLLGCTKLDVNPLSEGSSENWYSDETEITLALNDLYRTYLWDFEINYNTERMSDNWTQRQAIDAFPAGSVNSEWSRSEDLWLSTYKGITRANTILNSLDNATGKVAEAKIKQLAAEASLMRAVFYARLVFYYGDVPFYTGYLNIDDAFELGRTDKEVVLQQVYKDFDAAIESLPVSYGSNELGRATKGAALAFKARAALYMGDWVIARDAAKACMDLQVYSLHPNYGEYFLSKTRNSPETVFALPRSFELGSSWGAKNFYTRTPGGSAVAQPSWELFCAYPCTDGLPIDESPLFNPREPFKNRDPRCAMTIVEFGTEHLGVIYNPNPYATKVLNMETEKMVANKDTRSVDTYASYNGLALKKGVDEDWSDNNETDFDIRIMRYADVLLMYAEAQIELNEIDASVLDAINAVRARAYGVDVTNTTAYPALTATSQEQLRKELRNERRIEFAWENRRFDDLLRWRLAEKALIRPIYGILDPNDLKQRVVDQNLWFYSQAPEIDENWLPDFSALHNAGTVKVLVERNFDKERQYLFPIPSKEIIINKNLKQNPNY
ncbi:RagB/SusD family nutrient uptake outer membrane protein [Pontibacter actiniarum]|uniref:RagB/SusD family nutrient uptake outer membrane protein n=1 Tax=Pontibacter actiniarum TaxID=323450 RepID=A0A1X9YT21_9BACT|nr:RagB/SusD family nutrient uptake outer membrane protein [Pontibacter actiniarum]ARS36002.1 RagB/SusD family nutrient uptake outer membrane protein [Pontibacter actiniarum]